MSDESELTCNIPCLFLNPEEDSFEFSHNSMSFVGFTSTKKVQGFFLLTTFSLSIYFLSTFFVGHSLLQKSVLSCLKQQTWRVSYFSSFSSSFYLYCKHFIFHLVVDSQRELQKEYHKYYRSNYLFTNHQAFI